MADVLLCPELLDKIFSFLECKDLLKVAKVSPTWNSIAKLSLKRRLFLQLSNVDSDDEQYFLKFRKRELRGPAKLVELDPDQEDEEIEDSNLESLRFDGQLYIPLGSAANKNLPLLAILFMPESWALKITKLDFVDCGYLEYDDSDDSEDDNSDDSEDEKSDASKNDNSDDVEFKADFYRSLAVQDWNVAATQVLSKFPCLKKLHLQLKWIPDYVSTLEIPTYSEAIFESIEKISINLLALQHCEISSLQFATWCPNLKKFKIHGCDEDLEITFAAKYKKWNGVGGKLKLAYKSGITIQSVWKALVPVLKMLPFTLLKLDGGVSTLQLFDASMAANVKTLRVTLHSKTVKNVAEDVDLILTALHTRGFSAIEDLQLHWTETDGEDSAAAHDEKDDKIDFSLPSVKRLQLGGIDLGWEDADWNSTNKRLLKALPNIELMVVHCAPPMSDLVPENMRCSTRGIYPIRFLKYASEFKQLRHLVWDWDFCKKNLTELRRLRKVPKYLARLQALESLTIRLAGSKPLPPLEAVIEGCSALQRMRLLQVYARPDSELAQTPEILEHAISKVTSFCIRMVPRRFNLDYIDFQIDSLDKLCTEWISYMLDNA